MPYILEHPEWPDRTYTAQSQAAVDEWAKTGWIVKEEYATEAAPDTGLYPSDNTFPSSAAPTPAAEANSPAPQAPQTGNTAKGQE